MVARFTACVSRSSCLKPRRTVGKRGSQFMVKPWFTYFSVEPRLASASDGESRGSSAGQLRGEYGTSSTLVRRKWGEPRLAALLGPVYIQDRYTRPVPLIHMHPCHAPSVLYVVVFWPFKHVYAKQNTCISHRNSNHWLIWPFRCSNYFNRCNYSFLPWASGNPVAIQWQSSVPWV